jgi:hypothetical protein
MKNSFRFAIWLLAGLLIQAASVLANDASSMPLTATVGDFLKIPVTPNPASTDLCQQANNISLRFDGLDTGLHAVGCDSSVSGASFLMFRLARGDAQAPSADIAWARILAAPWDRP